MTTPRPLDFLQAEILRLRDLRARYTHADQRIAEQMRGRIDDRIDLLLDEISEAHGRRAAAMAAHPSAGA